MNKELKLFVVLLGGRPDGVTIEQHNVFFGIAYELEDLYGAIKRFWPAVRKIHIDAYMCVGQVGDYDVVICEKSEVANLTDLETEKKLFFVNLGFYQEGVFTERHEYLLEVALSESEVKTVLKVRFESIHYESSELHIDDCHVLYDNLDVEIPDDIKLAQEQFVVCLKRVRSDSALCPRVMVGYWKLP
mgnify:CR=1 FL=1